MPNSCNHQSTSNPPSHTLTSAVLSTAPCAHLDSVQAITLALTAFFPLKWAFQTPASVQTPPTGLIPSKPPPRCSQPAKHRQSPSACVPPRSRPPLAASSKPQQIHQRSTCPLLLAPWQPRAQAWLTGRVDDKPDNLHERADGCFAEACRPHSSRPAANTPWSASLPTCTLPLPVSAASW
jgi:hypothetical protein